VIVAVIAAIVIADTPLLAGLGQQIRQHLKA